MPRLTFDRLELLDGIGLVPVVMGLFGVAEILANLEKEVKRDIIAARIGGLWPSADDWVRSRWAIVRGTVLGFFLGILPGGGAVISSFASYAMEKQLSDRARAVRKGRDRRRGGTGGRQQRRGRRSVHSSDDAWASRRMWSWRCCSVHLLCMDCSRVR